MKHHNYLYKEAKYSYQPHKSFFNLLNTNNLRGESAQFSFNQLRSIFLISLYFLMKIKKYIWKFKYEDHYIWPIKSFLQDSFLLSFYQRKNSGALLHWTISKFLSKFFKDQLSMHLKPWLNLQAHNMLVQIVLLTVHSMGNSSPCFLLIKPLGTIFYLLDLLFTFFYNSRNCSQIRQAQ